MKKNRSFKTVMATIMILAGIVGCDKTEFFPEPEPVPETEEKSAELTDASQITDDETIKIYHPIASSFIKDVKEGNLKGNYGSIGSEDNILWIKDNGNDFLKYLKTRSRDKYFKIKNPIILKKMK